ncbi:MAG: helix-turn-helix domain-containing protein [Eubacteriales bacterium]|nr:helix-turn-helix domain-containing protein [Eubacteriales bacterium]
MHINLGIIADELSRYPSRHLKTRRFPEEILNLRGVCLYKKGMAFAADLAYVISAADVTEKFVCPNDMTLIVAGAAPEELFRTARADVLIFEVPRRKEAFYELFNEISGVFIKYQELDARIRTAIIKNASLQEIVRMGEALFGNPIIIFDKNYCVLNEIDSSIQGIEWSVDKWSGAKMLPMDTVNIIKTSPEYVRSDASGDTYFVSNGYLNYNTILSSIRRESVFLTVAVMETHAPLTKSHQALARYFGNIVYLTLCKNNFNSGHSMRFETFLKELLYNSQIEQAIIDRYLLTMNWKNTDHYICVSFRTNRWDKISSVYNNICINIENQFPDSFAFYYDDHIVMVLNLDRAKLTKPQAVRALSGILMEGVFRVGISYVFFDFSTFASYYRQTLGALEMGEKYRPHEWCYDFQDYVLHYFMHYGASRIDGRHLCFPGVVQLYIYDEENGTELLQTLRVYLECGRNAALTAKTLYIHRNTLYQRLERIGTILGADLDDLYTRLFILMSYIFVELLALEPIR